MSKKPARVPPIPRGFRSLTPHVTTADVGEAVSLYETAFDAVVISSETIPDTETVMFAQIKIGNSLLTIGRGKTFGPGFVSLHHYVEDADAIWEKALEAGFTVMSPLAETYWGDKAGVLVDPVGVRWSIGQRVTKINAQQRRARAREAMEQAVADAKALHDQAEKTAASSDKTK